MNNEENTMCIPSDIQESSTFPFPFLFGWFVATLICLFGKIKSVNQKTNTVIIVIAGIATTGAMVFQGINALFEKEFLLAFITFALLGILFFINVKWVGFLNKNYARPTFYRQVAAGVKRLTKRVNQNFSHSFEHRQESSEDSEQERMLGKENNSLFNKDDAQNNSDANLMVK